MRFLILFLSFLSLASCSFGQDWSPIFTKVEHSLVIVTNEEGFCTGFVINAAKGTILTAAHCIGGEEKADGQEAEILKVDKDNDLAVLRIEDCKKPPLLPRIKPVEPGLAVASLGYAYRLPHPVFRTGYVSYGPALLPDFKGEAVMIDYTPLKGMSGGPVIDGEGNVVSITQIGDGMSGLGRSINQIWSLTKTWW